MKKWIISFYRKNKKTILLVLRIAISVSLIVYLVSTKIESFSDIIEILKSSNKFLLLLSLSTHALGTYITAARWKTLLNTQGVKLSNMTLSSTVLIGSFFNNFLPTSIGGDVFRAYDASKKGNISLGSSASVILVERFSGVVSAATYAIIALFLGFTTIGHQSIIVPIIIFFVVTLILALLIINPSLFRLGKITRKFRFMRKIADKLSNFYNTLISFKKYKVALVEVLAFSFLLQFSVILNYWLASIALGIDLNLTAFIFIVPIVAVIAMLPISIGGIGLRENSLVIIMVAMGANNEKAALCSLLILLMLIIMGIIGGITYIVRPYFEGKFKKRSA
ncbi:MAG TPA: lysylphosphatidylglycerol synthase transmembrane domain-containing protein [Candidatus Humimicrobiaceae bacterium]|nr:lysylphosphatidylglycerol synthase transmembrane domain-containing protein [Candidatus Humimicrobiaceae bacterium]